VIAGLRRELGDRQIAEQVAIRETGCMKKCKAGPNLVMPDKTRHSRVRAKDIPALLDKHGLSRDRMVG
jgi:(2Fe-2S) ferredoxin